MTTAHRVRSVTIKEVAAHCGVSKSLVSYALQGDPRVKETTRARILAAARELGYDPAAHDAARRLVARREAAPFVNHLVALFFPPEIFGENGYYARIAAGVMDALGTAGFGILMNYLPNDLTTGLPPVFNRGEVDGVIACGGALPTAEIRRRLAALPASSDRPVVSVVWDDPVGDAVIADNHAGGALTVQHLLALGHRHLLVLVPPETGPGVRNLALRRTWRDPLTYRLQGMHAALREAGLDPACHLHPWELPLEWIDPKQLPPHRALSGAVLPSAAGETLCAYLYAHPMITAMIALNDPAAFQAWLALRQGGILVPEQISIIGYDDTDPVFDGEGRNLLTTVRLPLGELGVQAARRVVRRITRETVAERVLTLSVELVTRHSTAPASR